MNISKLLTDDAILAEMGKRIARCRLDRQLTQADVAERAGVSKRTVERIEAGASAQLSTIIRILRVLNLLQGVDLLIPKPGPRPMDLLKLKGKVRQRASSNRRPNRSNKKWSWGDDA
jgi:transcriptional regulator with XRE-family HTH domain